MIGTIQFCGWFIKQTNWLGTVHENICFSAFNIYNILSGHFRSSAIFGRPRFIIQWQKNMERKSLELFSILDVNPILVSFHLIFMLYIWHHKVCMCVCARFTINSQRIFHQMNWSLLCPGESEIREIERERERGIMMARESSPQYIH